MRGAVTVVIIAFFAFGSMATISLVGKPREPLTGGVAAATVLTQAALSIGVYWLWAAG